MGDKQHDPDRDRVFVRALEGKYSLNDELGRLRAMPRVIKGKDLKLDGGPQHFSRHYVEPEDGRTQTLHIHLEEYAPGGTTQKHGHVNEAAFYILDGAGYEIHDGVPAFQRQCQGAGARARDQDQADVPVHEHAVPAHGREAAEDAIGDARQFRPPPGGRKLQLPDRREGRRLSKARRDWNANERFDDGVG